MKIVINGKEKEITVLYGSHAVFTYENICIQADISANQKPIITVEIEGTSLVVRPSERVEIPIDEVPVFNVQITNKS
ncbi:hypothetical protein [Pseudoalteromonas ruthenica]|uniref:hypothetical protein n=1 Tax=Pseudoalteromonas ruthenica TaxID=151081 RepID=UPI00110C0A2A|nr:hypothetical protein [Pseudoalteromonas ruthenica]TMO97562.1 hypothetical protein CWC07_13860 [Pseudoalteromonas ruthenica]